MCVCVCVCVSRGNEYTLAHGLLNILRRPWLADLLCVRSKQMWNSPINYSVLYVYTRVIVSADPEYEIVNILQIFITCYWQYHIRNKRTRLPYIAVESTSLRLFWQLNIFCLLYIRLNKIKFRETAKFGFSLPDILRFIQIYKHTKKYQQYHHRWKI